jgi:hypothetical protein
VFCVVPTSGSNLPILQLHNKTEALWSPDIQPTESKHLKITQRSAALTWKLPGLAFTKSAVLSVVSGLVTQQEADSIMSKIPHEISIKPDSVDSLPAYEYVLFTPDHQLEDATKQTAGVNVDGSISVAEGAGQSVRALALPLVRSRILPFVRQHYNCSNCRMCHSLLRRYKSDERMEHPAHFDTQVRQKFGLYPKCR